jgi:uncharacterized Zn finger protein
MVRVSIRIREGASRFDVSVQVQSIRRAVEIAADREANAAVRVSFPIDAEAFFVEEPATRTARLRRERPERVAA